MDVYIYQADIYCALCGARYVHGCNVNGVIDRGGEADYAQVCGSCLCELDNPVIGAQ